jgi:hypothetical protein
MARFKTFSKSTSKYIRFEYMPKQSNIGSATAVNANREGGCGALIGGLGRE